MKEVSRGDATNAAIAAKGNGSMMKYILVIAASLLLASNLEAQNRSFLIHQRGTLHETIYNTGEIGRAYDQGNSGSIKGIPSFQWPGRSEVVIDQVQYNGQNNSYGGGMYLSANAGDTPNRLYVYCGGVGSNVPEAVLNRFSFPLELSRTMNLPLNSDGTVNTAYNPDEAEEIIVSSWATPAGLTVKRTSRAWSHPDYDDFIIYEYEITNTGDRNGIPSTVEYSGTLTDVLVAFQWGLNPSQFASERIRNDWRYEFYEPGKDMRRRFDRRRWLNYAMQRDGMPEPQYFNEWATSNVYGGGLLAPQAVGFLPLHFDTTYLASLDETVLDMSASDSALVWVNGKVKQPFVNFVETSNFRSGKVEAYLDLARSRRSAPYRNPIYGQDWMGRAAFNWRQSKKNGIGSILAFGPYTIPFGATVRFSIAQVAGYGAARPEQTLAGLIDEGGSCGELCGEVSENPAYYFNPVPNLWQPLVYGLDNTTYGSNYLSNYPLPEYINSNVVTVREVADRAIQAYTGQPLIQYDSTQYWPDQTPAHGVYQIPQQVPSPVVNVRSNELAENLVTWKPGPEQFTSARLQGTFSHYEVFRSNHPLGPWTKIDSVSAGDLRYFADGEYGVKDHNTRVGESFYYAVVTVDAVGNRSSRSTGNLILHSTQLGGTEALGQVTVVPNPFIVKSGFAGATATSDPSGTIGFYNLPLVCTIRIFSYSGQLVQTLEHNSGLYSTAYLQVTRNNQLMASGLYFYVVETPSGERTSGKFVIIR